MAKRSSVPFYDKEEKLLGARGIARDITERKLHENELRNSQKQLRELSGHLQSVREEERRNLARELHDEFGQSMTALKIELVRLGDKLPNSGDSQKKVGAKNHLDSAFERPDKIRKICMIKILIADDHAAVVRHGLKQIITDQTNMRVCGEAENSAEICDVIVLDITMPGGKSGLDLLPEIKELQPTAKILILRCTPKNNLPSAL